LFVNQIPPFFWGLLLLLSAFLFKQGAFPFHLWVCDVYEGSPLSVTMFFVLIPKAILFCLFAKIFFLTFGLYYSFWTNICIFCGFFSIFLGNIAALYQKKIKRLLAFSAISHTGFILLSFCCFSTFAIKAFSFYFLIYIIMNVVFFSIVIVSFSNQNFLKYLINWSDTGKRNFMLIFAFSCILLSTAGIPPLSGFYSKLLVFVALIQQNWIILTIFVTFFSCIGCYYYIRIIKTFFFRNKNSNIWIFSNMKSPELIISMNTIFILTLLIFPDIIIYLTDFISFSI
jgi:NADH-quinone oxidoreductase subunit N